MTDKLEEFYLSKESDFQNLMKMLYEEGLYSQASHPQLMALWADEPIPKVMFIGKEPNGWEAQEGETINGLINEYKKFNLGANYYNSPFWSWVWWMSQELGLIGDHPFLYNNINKICAVSGGAADPRVTEFENKFFNIFQEELNIIRPKVCIFLTGPNYDNEIKSKLPNAHIKPIPGFTLRQMAIVEHECLPLDSYRLYHPKYGNFNQEMYTECFDYIKKTILEHGNLNSNQ